MSNNSKPKIFISYSWDSGEYKEKVASFVNTLRKYGINCIIDRFRPRINPNLPWSAWIDKHMLEADCILVVCSSNYKECFESLEENGCVGEGGIFYEAKLIKEFINKNEKRICTVLLQENDNQFIPTRLNGYDRFKIIDGNFNLETCNESENLYRFLTNQPDVEMENLGNVINFSLNEIQVSKEDEELQNYKDDSHNPYNEIINILKENNFSIEEIKNISKHYLENIHFNEFQNLTTIEKIVSKLYDLEKLPCVVKELFGSNLPTEVSSWLSIQQAECNRIVTEAENEENEPRLVVIFDSKHEGKKYSVRFITHNIPGVNDQNDDNGGKVYDLDKEDSRIELIKDMMKYIEDKNPLVDLILPTELMTEDIILWEAEWNESLSRLAKVNIRAKRRYDINDKNIKQRYIEQWESKQQYEELYPINNENEIQKIGNNMDKAGLSSKYILKEKHLKYILKTDMSFIMLWQTTDTDFDLTNLHSEGLDKLRQNYYTLIKNKSINLMWDDPKNYYYPN